MVHLYGKQGSRSHSRPSTLATIMQLIGNIIFCQPVTPRLNRANEYLEIKIFYSWFYLVHFLRFCTYFEKFIYVTIYDVLNVCHAFRSLTIPSSHLSRNEFQCNPRRKHMCTSLQRQYKWLHSYMGCYCIR